MCIEFSDQLLSLSNMHFRFLHVLTIVNSAAMKIGVHVSFQIRVSLDVCPGVRLLDHTVTLFLVF